MVLHGEMFCVGLCAVAAVMQVNFCPHSALTRLPKLWEHMTGLWDDILIFLSYIHIHTHTYLQLANLAQPVMLFKD